jgi:hypothetical protein
MLDYQIKVEGNSYLKPSGDLIVYSGDKIEKTTSLNPNQRIVLPGSSRQFSMYQRPVLKNPFGISVEASGESVEFMPVSLFGSKTVETKIAFSNGSGGIETLSKKTEITFWPWKTVIALTSLVLIILGGWQLLNIIKKQNAKLKMQN